MARKRSSQKRAVGAFQALPVNANLDLATLANATVAGVNLTGLADDYWLQSADLSWTMDGHTAGEGPILVGIASGDLSVAEVKEAINAVPTSRSDRVAREHASRPVRRVGQFDGAAAGEKLFDGAVKRTPGKIYCAEGDEIIAWAFNGSGAPLTDGTNIRIYGTLYGSWK